MLVFRTTIYYNFYLRGLVTWDEMNRLIENERWWGVSFPSTYQKFKRGEIDMNDKNLKLAAILSIIVLSIILVATMVITLDFIKETTVNTKPNYFIIPAEEIQAL